MIGAPTDGPGSMSYYQSVQVEEHLVWSRRRFEKIDVLVNCAGWDRLLPFLKTTPDLWQKVMTINDN